MNSVLSLSNHINAGKEGVANAIAEASVWREHKLLNGE